MINLWIDSKGLSKESCCHQGEMSNKYLVLPKENFFGECEAVILIMLYVKVLLGMVPHNS